jgi:hypothetical protein
VLPWGCTDGWLAMLTAYFDDSGTHDDSDIVLWAGVAGNQFQWQAFDDAWRAKLAAPSPGKPPLSRFHMWDCQNACGEFEGWSRTATNFLVHELGEIILRKGLWGYACAVRRKDWDDLVLGEARNALGDAEGFCVRSVYVKTTDWARNWGGDSDLAFVFDNRPQRRAENQHIFEMFQRNHKADRVSPELVSITFASSQKIQPLQAADMIAWEFFAYATDIFHGRTQMFKPLRPQISRFFDSGRYRAQLATRKNIEEIADKAATSDLEIIKTTADYFAQLGIKSPSSPRPSLKKGQSS